MCYENGLRLDREENTAAAIREYEQAVRLDPSFAAAFCNLGYDYGLFGNPQKEIQCYEHALQIKPDYVKALHNLAMTYVGIDDIEKAKAVLRKLKEIEPNRYREDVEAMIRSMHSQQ